MEALILVAATGGPTARADRRRALRTSCREAFDPPRKGHHCGHAEAEELQRQKTVPQKYQSTNVVARLQRSEKKVSKVTGRIFSLLSESGIVLLGIRRVDL